MYHKTGRKCSGEDWDDLNEQVNDEFGRIRRPGPASILRFSQNLNLYRENHRHLLDMCDDGKEREGRSLGRKTMQMGEDIDAIVIAYQVAYGSTMAQMQMPSAYSKLAQCGFNAENAASGRLFQKDSSFAELKKYVAAKLSAKDGLHAHPEAGAAPAEAGAEADLEVDAQCGDDSSSSNSEDDDVPLSQAITNQRRRWVSQHKPAKGETLEDYHCRLVRLMNAGVMGDSSMLLGTGQLVKTLQDASDAHHKESGGSTPNPVVLKIKEHRKVRGQVQYLVQYRKPACLPRPSDVWVVEEQLTNAETLLSRYKTDNQLATGETFEVEEILGKRVSSTGLVEYLVKWKGYRRSNKYWEPHSNLTCAELIDDYNQNKCGQKRKRASKPRKSQKKVVEDSDDADDSDYE
jgi:hypothetical protein